MLRDKIRAATARSRTERPVTAVVADLNPVLRGWAAYFRNGHSGRKFTKPLSTCPRRVVTPVSTRSAPTQCHRSAA
ncbi:group II intron maturase-specific domain-containing protein [Streptomyces sp. NPDC001404]|uniref:group II intron maturase-specific domain-containing protein n=1 Tax=Streptomyces sp. NPDC001404 TaxID=3364571 RepID=UPI0036A99452